MNGIPGWVGPTMAISLAIIALAFLVMGAVALFIGLGLRSRMKQAGAQVAKIRTEVEQATARARKEVEGYASLSAEARGKLRGAMDAVDTRLRDLDALIEVLQTEAEETALDAAAFMRTVRRSGSMLGVARAALKSRRRGGK